MNMKFCGMIFISPLGVTLHSKILLLGAFLYCYVLLATPYVIDECINHLIHEKQREKGIIAKNNGMHLYITDWRSGGGSSYQSKFYHWSEHW